MHALWHVTSVPRVRPRLTCPTAPVWPLSSTKVLPLMPLGSVCQSRTMWSLEPVARRFPLLLNLAQ
jgi:hypothetical protein